MYLLAAFTTSIIASEPRSGEGRRSLSPCSFRENIFFEANIPSFSWVGFGTFDPQLLDHSETVLEPQVVGQVR